MSGCFDGALAMQKADEEDQTSTIDESGTINQPLIYGECPNCIGECYMNGQSYYSRDLGPIFYR